MKANIIGAAVRSALNAGVLGLTGQDYNLTTLDEYKVNRPGQPEVIRQRIYDFQLYPTAGQMQLTFFAVSTGGGITTAAGAVVGTAKTLADSNLPGAGGQFPRPISYLAESIEVIFEPGSSAAANTFVQQAPGLAIAVAAVAIFLTQVNDVNVVYKSGWLEFFIGSKTYLTESPLLTFPPKVRLEIDASIGNGDTTTHNAIALMTSRAGGRPYYLDPPITLETLQNFNIFLKWPGVVATAASNGRIGVVLDGVLFRLSQ